MPLVRFLVRLFKRLFNDFMPLVRYFLGFNESDNHYFMPLVRFLRRLLKGLHNFLMTIVRFLRNLFRRSHHPSYHIVQLPTVTPHFATVHKCGRPNETILPYSHKLFRDYHVRYVANHISLTIHLVFVV